MISRTDKVGFRIDGVTLIPLFDAHFTRNSSLENHPKMGLCPRLSSIILKPNLAREAFYRSRWSGFL